jgi:2,3-dihydroxyethylbenzene 1,2-dioxygenase
MSKVSELGYVGIGVSDMERWKDYCTSIIGLEYLDDGETDRFYLRADEWHHRFTVHPSSDDDCLYMGWRVADKNQLDEIRSKLDENAISYQTCSGAEADERRVLGLIKLKDPSNNSIELFYGPQVDAHKPFHPGRPMYGRFATSPKGLGHCIIRQDDIPAGVSFYRMLGFEGDIEYRMTVPNGGLFEPVFMHLNARQHSIAFGAGMTEKRIHHVMLEYTNLKDLGRAHDLAVTQNIGIPMSLGMHANDEMLSFYMLNPSKWTFEMGWGGRNAMAQQEYYCHDVFGHFSKEAKG